MAVTVTSAPLASPPASAIGGSLEDLLAELGYRDCIGALHRYRVEHPRDVELLSIFLMDYPFADRLFPAALVVLKWLNSLGPTVILSDGDVVFQSRKVEHAGLSDAVHGRVLTYIHKEEALDNVERRSPHEHYVPSPRQVAYSGGDQALPRRAGNHRLPAPGNLCSRPESGQRFPTGGRDVERSRDLLDCDLPQLRAASRPLAPA